MDWTILFLGGLGLLAFGSILSGDDDDGGDDDREPERASEGDNAYGDDDDLVRAEGTDEQRWDFSVDQGSAVKGVGDEAADERWGLGLEDDGTLLYSRNDDGGFVTQDILPGITEVATGGGEDTVIASGNGVFVNGEGGDDRIDARDLESGFILGGEGDTIIGSDAAGDRQPDGEADVIVDGSGFRFEGGSSDEDVRITGDDDAEGVVDGAGGDDHLLTDGGNVTLSGGSGDDVIASNWDRFDEGPGDPFDAHVGAGDDEVDGGSGDDSITFDRADTVSGGDGDDSLRGYVSGEETAVITDFDPDEDSLRLVVEGDEPITFVETDDGTEMRIDGETAALIEGRTDLSIGYLDLAKNDIIVDAFGNPFDGTPDIVVEKHFDPA